MAFRSGLVAIKKKHGMANFLFLLSYSLSNYLDILHDSHF